MKNSLACLPNILTNLINCYFCDEMIADIQLGKMLFRACSHIHNTLESIDLSSHEFTKLFVPHIAKSTQ